MSSHFNYEIEERNMRSQLKELEFSYKEDAWLNYEEYAKQFQSVNKTQLLPNFNFALNRTVILPVVFGGIIILFSFLLFNFINIKNTNATAKTDVTEMKASMDVVAEKPKPEPKKAVVVPVKKAETPVIKETAILTNTVAVLPNTNTGNALIAKTLPAVQTNTAATLAVTNPSTSINTLGVKTATTYTFDPKKKRRKKNTVEVLESIATPISLPTVTQEEAEPELR
ncbi:MAG: hypothetical protein H0W73_06185 [Bacteroidetes bacterium]|nr:hypothetical protein [Bacteroidota bacterium]